MAPGHHHLAPSDVMACRRRPAHLGGRATVAARATGTAAHDPDMPDADGHTAAEVARLFGYDEQPAALSPTLKIGVSLSSTPAEGRYDASLCLCAAVYVTPKHCTGDCCEASHLCIVSPSDKSELQHERCAL